MNIWFFWVAELLLKHRVMVKLCEGNSCHVPTTKYGVSHYVNFWENEENTLLERDAVWSVDLHQSFGRPCCHDLQGSRINRARKKVVIIQGDMTTRKRPTREQEQTELWKGISGFLDFIHLFPSSGKRGEEDTFYLRTETVPVSKTSCSFKHRTMDKVQNPEIPCVIHQSHKPSQTTCGKEVRVTYLPWRWKQ
jgi:hypothetical protein